MFRRATGLCRSSEEKLKFGVSFYLNTIKLKKIIIVRHPTYLLYSLQNRVIPRYIVLEILKSKRLLKKLPSFPNVVGLPKDVFLDKFISKSPSNAEGLLTAYRNIFCNLLKKQKQNRLHILMNFSRNQAKFELGGDDHTAMYHLFITMKAINPLPTIVGWIVIICDQL